MSGADQRKLDAVRGWNRKNGAVGKAGEDGLGRDMVVDLCKGTDAPMMVWGTVRAGMSMTDVEEVDCGEWSGTVRKVMETFNNVARIARGICQARFCGFYVM